VKHAYTRGQPAALEAVGGMVAGVPPHAILLAGPAGVGKTTLALDLAAGLLCTASDPTDRPCRACRACRMVEHGNHPDVHWLRPEGPGGQVVIGGPEARFRGVRELISALALLPVEGGARVAIIERADRMNDDAQSALLKTLEEPPPGVTIVLCANDEERLLPTVRSRCARIRLGPVGPRAIEEILAEHDLADAPTAARLGRLAGGRPGMAIAYARAPDAAAIRGELERELLDLVDARPSARLAAARALVARAGDLVAVLDRGAPAGDDIEPGPDVAPDSSPEAAPESAVDGGAKRAPASERRRGAALLLSIWVDVARDLALVGAGELSSLHDSALLEELESVASGVPARDVASFLERLARAGELLDVNVAPELLVDALVLAWPARVRAA
jgi:DNA polymerase III delta' subunit